MDHIVKQAKLSENTIKKNNCATYLALNAPAPKVHTVKTVYFVKWSTKVKMALQLLAQEGGPMIKSKYQDPNLLSAMGKGSSKSGGAYVLSLACWQT